MTEFEVIPTCDSDSKTFDTKAEAQAGKQTHIELCATCTSNDVLIDDGIDNMDDVAVVNHTPDSVAATADGSEPTTGGQIDSALNQDHAKRTEWWANETTRIDKVRSEILANAMLRDDTHLVARTTETDTSGVHELSFTVHVHGVPLNEYEVATDE